MTLGSPISTVKQLGEEGGSSRNGPLENNSQLYEAIAKSYSDDGKVKEYKIKKRETMGKMKERANMERALWQLQS